MPKSSPIALAARPMPRPRRTFARALVEHAGQVSQAEFAALRTAGHSDAEIVEIITHVAMNIFTNILGKATQVEIDFPKVALNAAA